MDWKTILLFLGGGNNTNQGKDLSRSQLQEDWPLCVPLPDAHSRLMLAKMVN